MDNLENLENKSPAPQPGSNPDLEQLRADYDSLSYLVFSLLVLLFIVSGTLSFYLYRELSYARRELTAARLQIGPRINEYNQAVPTIQNFLKQLTEYGRTHPDFGPIMDKYRLRQVATNAPSAATSAPAATPTPAHKAPATKK